MPNMLVFRPADANETLGARSGCLMDVGDNVIVDEDNDVPNVKAVWQTVDVLRATGSLCHCVLLRASAP